LSKIKFESFRQQLCPQALNSPDSTAVEPLKKVVTVRILRAGFGGSSQGQRWAGLPPGPPPPLPPFRLSQPEGNPNTNAGQLLLPTTVAKQKGNFMKIAPLHHVVLP
jgi:hypothetical protein